MSMNLNAESSSIIESIFNIAEIITPQEDVDLLSKLLDASSKIPGLTSVSAENLEVIEHLGAGRDLIISGPERLTSLTCAALPVIAGCGLVVMIARSMNSLRRMKLRFENLNISIESFDLAPTKAEKRHIWESMDRGEVKILLVTPGRLASQRFRERLKRRNISIVIIDQAHLMSPWSHKFTPQYRFVGSFLSSLGQCNGNIPQKIALIWNSSGKINQDLSKLLSLRTPYMGRLVADALPGVGVESTTIANDLDRNKLILQEIDRCGGQGVIYCNSIKQMYDTSALLQGRAEEFAVIKPGTDEFTLAKIREDFESGSIRIVVTLGAFLSEIETAMGLEFVIFNGMPESPESIARELFGVEDAGFIRSLIVVGEKDYYQHRFVIDKNFPDALVMRACVEGVRDVFGSKIAVSPETLSSHVKMATPFPQEDIEQCIQVLYREGILEKVLDQDSAQFYVKLAATPEEEASFWHEYPLRKIDQITRLDKMKELTLKDGDRSRQLQSYIR